jgi:hypothetical protein
MEIRIVLFLAFVTVNVITNTLIIFFAYRAFAGAVSKATETASQFQKSSETRAWIESVRVAAERAATVTESAKVKMAESNTALSNAEETYRRTLVRIDVKVKGVADDMEAMAETARDIVAKPVVSASKFAAGVVKVLQNFDKHERR